LRKIINNYLLLTRTNEFTADFQKYFYQRLGIFLCLDLKESPDLLFTSNLTKISEAYGKELSYYGSAFYTEDKNMTVFYVPKFDIKDTRFRYKKKLENIRDDTREGLRELGLNFSQFRYIIPLSDIYHELVHAIQYQYGQYIYDDLLEATNEIITYVITGQWNIEYIKESFSLWYVYKYELKASTSQFYSFIRNCIVSKDFDSRYFLSNANFINMLSEYYKGKMEHFLYRYKIDYYNEYYDDYSEEFEKDLNYIHNLIFYKY
jgi:hypothetical protein